MRSMLPHVGRVGAAASVTLALQGTAIVTLAPHDYGLFASFYIVLGVGNAAVYSLVSEPWAIQSRSEPWASYSTALIFVAGLALIPVILVAIAADQRLLGGLFGVAIFASIWRLGARYYSVAEGQLHHVTNADLLGAVVFLVVYVLAQAFLPGLESIGVAWTASSLATLLLSERFVLRPRRYPPIRWLREHWKTAKHLATDSALLEAGSAGTLIILSPLMGLANFGVYRSISSTGLPVRLVLNPLRPNLANARISTLVSGKVTAALVVVALLFGLACWVTLTLIEVAGFFSDSTLAALATFKIPASLFVAASLAETYYYLCLRVKFAGVRLVAYRGAQLALALALPLAGFTLAGLGGAVWGYVAMTLMMALVSGVLLHVLGHRASGTNPEPLASR